MGSDSNIDGRDVIYEIEVTPETRCAGQYADVPDAFRVVALPDNENCGLMVYSLYRGEWVANCNPRWLIRHLLKELKRLRNAIEFAIGNIEEVSLGDVGEADAERLVGLMGYLRGDLKEAAEAEGGDSDGPTD